jgi:type VI secretion system protein ImpG
MRDALLTYYERELTYLRRMAVEFADKYPKIAKRLVLEPDKCEDPHVERLIEACAFLAARVHLKIDDEFPEITESLLQVLYPHYLCPVPSMSVVQFFLDPEKGKVSTGYEIERFSTLYARAAQDTTCRFRTAYPVTLWPVRVESARLEIPGPTDGSGRSFQAALRLGIETQGDANFSELEISSLRVFLDGESQLVSGLYEALLGACGSVELRNVEEAAEVEPIQLALDSLREVGFGVEEGMMPYSHRSFMGYRLLQEYFTFPQKFFFFDVHNLDHLRMAKFEKRAELIFHLNEVPRIRQEVDKENFRLGCAPIVNFYQRSAEPIRLDHAHTEYRVIPDVHHQFTAEVYSIDKVVSVSPREGRTVEYQPFYSFKHAFRNREKETFWHATRRWSQRKNDPGTEVYLSLVDLDFRPSLPADEVVNVSVTCTNRDLPGLLDFGDPDGDFELDEGAPIEAVRCLVKPTRTRRPPLRHGAQWRLISHLSLNYLSLVEGSSDGGPEALQEILNLYNFAESEAERKETRQHIEGIIAVHSRQVIRRVRTKIGSGFARGIETTVDFDESRYVGSGVYLFASVLEKFLGLYVSINSFSEMIAKTKQRGALKKWPPRTGHQILL